MTTATYAPSVRAQLITRSRYNRPLDDGRFESWDQTIDRVIDHQRWLWERAQGGPLVADQAGELAELKALMVGRRAALAGRTLWLGGTEISRRRECSQFNCSGLEVRTVHDVVDAFWLLLNGAGVGFRPVNGCLCGFARRMEVEVRRSARDAEGGEEHNAETYDESEKTWTIRVGDSAVAWAKAAGKLMAGKFPARKLVLDLREIRGPGQRLKGYGWISSGDRALATALEAICGVMNRRAGRLLSKQDIWDIVNWLGTVLSSRRSAQWGGIDYGDPEWHAIATMKPPGFDAPDSPIQHRRQSNNSVVFHEYPGRRAVRDIFEMMAAHGGGEPGFVNAEAARRRAPWFKVFNPCVEICLSNYGFCNLCDIDVAKFADDHEALHRALWVMARANYRQTLVNLRDGVLQSAWHETNEHLRLCGVGLCGIVRRPDLTPHDYRMMRNTATAGAYGMADELGLERPKNVTTVKPGGTVPKCLDTTEGMTAPDAEFIFNNVIFSRHDPLVPRLLEANYRIADHPNDPQSCLVTLPVSFAGTRVFASQESSTVQLERYRVLMRDWCDQNVSNTIRWNPSDIPALVKWFDRHWDDYVGTAFMFDQAFDASAFGYLPQEVVDRDTFGRYASQLRPVDIDAAGSDLEAVEAMSLEDGCITGACPVR